MTATDLPPPSAVETLSFEGIYTAARSTFADLQRPNQPDIDAVLQLESEPAAKVLQAHSYREMLIRARLNDSVRAHFQPTANGADLDWIAQDFGVTRQDDETDSRLRDRIAKRIAALAGQGTREHYEYTALSASNQVRQAQATSPVAGKVLVMLWVWDQTQAQAVRELVNTAINAENARMLGVDVTVAVAVPKPINITAAITRRRTAPANLLAMLQQRLADGFATMATMSEGVARSYITALLQVDGVHAVEFPDPDRPAAHTVINVGQYPALGAVQLIDAGVV